MSDQYLNRQGVSEIWDKAKKIITPGDGLKQTGDVIDVETPVRDILSLDQFDALPEEKRNSGLYVIDDGTVYEGDVYSTEERKIGTWIDGSPLYRRTFQFVFPSSYTQGQDLVVATTPDTINTVNLYGMYQFNARQTQPLNTYSQADELNSFVFYRRGSIIAKLNSEYFAGKTAWVTLEYVKV